MEVVKTDQAPQAIGPYSQAVNMDGVVFCSGQIPLKADGQMVEGGIREQIVQVMENLKAVLTAAGTSMDGVLKTTIYLVDLADFAVVNEVYGSYFSGEIKPARATVQVAALPKGARVEVECIAAIS